MDISIYRGYRMHPHAELAAKKRGISQADVLATLLFGSRYPGRLGRTQVIFDEASAAFASMFGLSFPALYGLTLILNEAEHLVITCFKRMLLQQPLFAA